MLVLLRRIRALFTTRRFQREMAEEMCGHLEQTTALFVARGMSEQDAATAARREFGNVAVHQEEGRDARGVRVLEDLVSDVRHGIRQIRRAPTFATVVVVVLAIGLGINSTSFTIWRALFERMTPGVHDPKGLVRLSVVDGASSDQGASYPDFLDYRALTSTFSEVAAWTIKGPIPMDGGAYQGNASATFVSGSYFTVLGTHMALGTSFPTADDRNPTPEPLAIVGYRFWKERLGGGRAVIGRRISVNHVPVTVVGVAQDGFNGVGPQAARAQPDLWLPVSLYSTVAPRGGALASRDSLTFHMIARLRTGVAPLAAAKAASAVAAHIADTYPFRDSLAQIRSFMSTTRARAVRLDPPTVMPVGSSQTMQLESGVVFGTIGAMILLIACANASNLLLARAAGRRREIAVRLSLGAGRGRIVRQLLMESLLLALAAGALGTLLEVVVVHAVSAVGIFGLPSSFGVGWDTTIFAVSVALVSTLVFGLSPALHATRGSVSHALKSSVGGPDARQARQQSQSAVVQVALSFIFVCCSGPFIGLAYTVQHGLGFDSSDHVLVAKLDLRGSTYSGVGATALVDAVTRRLAALPGVSEVSSTNTVPFALDGNLPRMWRDDGSPILDANDLNAYRAAIDPGYFATMGIPMLLGHGLQPEDPTDTIAAAVIDARTAQVLWPGRNPIGQTVRVTRTADMLTVVGVVGSMRVDLDLGNEPAFVYVSRRRFPDSTHTALLLKTRGNAVAFAPAIRDAVEELDPRIIISDMQTLDGLRSSKTRGVLGLAELVSVLGVVAFVLAVVGLYAVVAFGVSQRIREIGIRMALGARRQEVLRFFLRRGSQVIGTGFAAGLPLALLALRIVARWMFPVSGQAAFIGLPVTGSAVALMTAGAALAVWIPARRAATVNPVVALRSDE